MGWLPLMKAENRVGTCVRFYDLWQQRNAVYDARAADLFACGVVGYVLATGTYPWQSTAGDCKARLQG